MTVKHNPRTGSADAMTCPTLIEFLLDETGSMYSCKNAVIDGFNAFLTEQRALGTFCQLTFTKFDSDGLKTPYVDLDIGMAIPLTDATFLPGSMTNLHDAIGIRLAAVNERISSFSERPNILFVVMTDGSENASRSYSKAAIQGLIKANSDLGITFVYLGSTPCANATALDIGFQPGNIKQFAANETRETFSHLAAATSAYRATRSSAATNEKSFFSASGAN